jgi:zinc D-Ala-D-Ala carboxypeptidase
MSGTSGAHRNRRPRVALHAATSRLVVLVLVAMVATGLAATVVSASSLPSCRVADTLTAQRKYTDWNRTVLDLTYRLSSGYVPGDLRSTANAGLNSGHRVRSLVIADLRAMASTARKAGARLAVQSAYRSYPTQRSTFAYWTRVSGYSAALKSSARAGHSEHQLGTTLDFRSYGGSAPWYYADWGKSKAGAWLKSNAWKYGFIMSYPKGKISVTCYAYEPWHYRYLGRAVAAKVHASGLTLREYLWRQQTAPKPTPTPTPAPSGSAEPSMPPSEQPSPPASDQPDATPIATPVDQPVADPGEPSPEPSPTPVATPTPTPTPPATPAPTPVEALPVESPSEPSPAG